ncbi:hypothetical protein ACOME3_000690 [Neoechinorhynchus agilis]
MPAPRVTHSFEPLVGSLYKTISSRGCVQEARLLKKRSNRQTGMIEYFAHYIDASDRRLDEWLTVDRIMNQCSNHEQNRRPSRGRRRNYNEEIDEMQDQSSNAIVQVPESTTNASREFQEQTMVKYIDKVNYYIYQITTWYFSPYPFICQKYQLLNICHRCFTYYRQRFCYNDHLQKGCRGPLGKVIYDHPNFEVRRVAGAYQLERFSCESLLLFGKLFLDSKTIFFDIDNYVFYVIYEKSKEGDLVAAGFYSKNFIMTANNLSTIIVFPPFQKKGYGRFLISFSYEMDPGGSPEKPLSDLGNIAYKAYWSRKLIAALWIMKKTESSCHIDELSTLTAIAKVDVIETLISLNIFSKITDDGWFSVRSDLPLHLVTPVKDNELFYDPQYAVAN